MDSRDTLNNGRYELWEFVSKGGMGAVYRGRDTELDRWVAVKCLLDVTRAEPRSRAVKEARTLASLSHPNIMRVYDILQDGDQVWIVSEWLEGRPLGQLPLPLAPAVVLAVMAQVYEALSAAHAAQVIHGDIKPANVMVGHDGRVTLIDFGVAYAAGSVPTDAVAGSLRYTDPRILEGETPDGLADLYSAAIMQIELMTGQMVLPDMPPLALYRHTKRHLAARLDILLDGAYPPLVSLARRFSSRFPVVTLPDAVGNAARVAALSATEHLRRLTPLTPADFLRSVLAGDQSIEEGANEHLATEAARALGDAALSPRQKAAWIAYQAASPGAEPVVRGPATAPGDSRSRLTMTLPNVRIGRGLSHPEAEHQSWLMALLAVMVLLLTGTVVWMLTRPDEIPPERPVASAASEYPASETLPEPVQELVEVHLSATAWASVFIDGKEAGKLPQAAPFKIPPGTHELRLENPSVETMTTTITVAPGSTERHHFELEPKVVARIFTLARPGRLIVDGVDHGIATKKSIPLSYGTHSFEVRRGAKIVRQKKIALSPDSPAEITIEQ